MAFSFHQLVANGCKTLGISVLERANPDFGANATFLAYIIGKYVNSGELRSGWAAEGCGSLFALARREKRMDGWL